MYTIISQYFREPVNTITHLVGVMLSVVALILLISRSMETGNLMMLTAFTIFGISLILLYLSSTLYHGIHASEETLQKFRRFDHMMIYVLIAGTFTPFSLLVIGGPAGNIIMGVMWFIAILGASFKLFMKGTAGWLSISLYIAMGWAGIAMIPFMLATLPVSGVIWLAAGGLTYTAGAIIYGLEKPNPFPNWFGHHEIWHLFVLGGSFAHFWSIYHYLG